MRKNYKGKRVLNGAPAHKSHGGKRVLGGSRGTAMTLLSLALVLLLSVGGTLAWLTARTETITNTFQLANFNIDIEEKFDNSIKSDVCVKNTSDVPVYIRVALVPTWVDRATGDPVGKQASLNDLTIDWGPEGGSEIAAAPGNDWIRIGDYWYYTTPVAKDASTKNLIDTATIEYEANSTEYLRLEVMADAIQAEPVKAVTEAWGVTVDGNGTITGAANP